MPSTVCSACVEILNDWALFKEKCVKSNNYLLSTIVEDHKDNANACINQDYNNIFSTEDSEVNCTEKPFNNIICLLLVILFCRVLLIIMLMNAKYVIEHLTRVLII